jgi:hypothetical protein
MKNDIKITLKALGVTGAVFILGIAILMDVATGKGLVAYTIDTIRIQMRERERLQAQEMLNMLLMEQAMEDTWVKKVEISEEKYKEKESQVIRRLIKKYGDYDFKVLEINETMYWGGDAGYVQGSISLEVEIDSKIYPFQYSYASDIGYGGDNLQSVASEVFPGAWKESNKDIILERLQAVNSRIRIVNCSISTYDGRTSNNKLKERFEENVQSIEIWANYSEYELPCSEFAEIVQGDVQLIYEHIVETYPRIPEGIGATHVLIRFDNGTQLRINPLSKDLSFWAREDEYTPYWDYLGQ